MEPEMSASKGVARQHQAENAVGAKDLKQQQKTDEHKVYSHRPFAECP